ncbi:MAG: MBL fold metallo-hydrolase [Thermodesulfobacteriota bacterium]|nr:MBL fold metallo-hydrolase [Thermodesulfobacteriota bacterium]
MIINKTGPIIENFYSIGHAAIPVYVMDGVHPLIFDAGFTFLGEIYAGEIKKILGNRQPEYLFLTHAHFDHCGSVSILKKHFPLMKVIASQKAKEILGRPHAIKLIRTLNQASKEMAGEMEIDFASSVMFQPFEIDQTVKDGDIVEISNGLNIRVIETPGHTSDCLSYYIREKRILMSSEAAGQPDRTGYIVSDCLLDYDQYFNSLKGLASIDIEILCPGHLFVYTGDDAKKYLKESMQECERFRQRVELCLVEEGGDLDRVKMRIKEIEYDNNDGPKQPEPAYLLNLEARIKAVAKKMNKTCNREGSVL